MTWTTSQPTGASKIRFLPDLLQQRWNNIQQGTVPSEKWLLAFRAGNPATVAEAGNIFTKKNSDGFVELFFKDDNSNTTRLTTEGGVGFYDQTLYGDEIVLNSTSEFAYTRDAMISAAGRVLSDGTLVAGSFNISSVSGPTSGSTYTVNFTTPMATADEWSVVCTVVTVGGTTLRIPIITEQTANRFKVKTFKDDSSTPETSDAGFSFIVVGGRPGE